MKEFFQQLTPFVILMLLFFSLTFQILTYLFFIKEPQTRLMKKYLRENPEFWEIEDAVAFFKKTLKRVDKNNIGNDKGVKRNDFSHTRGRGKLRP